MNATELVLKQFPNRVMVSMTEAGNAIGYADNTCYNLYAKGKFPIRVRKQGSKVMVSLVDLIGYLDGDTGVKSAPAEPTVRRGRPRNSERVSQ